MVSDRTRHFNDSSCHHIRNAFQYEYKDLSSLHHNRQADFFFFSGRNQAGHDLNPTQSIDDKKGVRTEIPVPAFIGHFFFHNIPDFAGGTRGCRHLLSGDSALAHTAVFPGTDPAVFSDSRLRYDTLHAERFFQGHRIHLERSVHDFDVHERNLLLSGKDFEKRIQLGSEHQSDFPHHVNGKKRIFGKSNRHVRRALFECIRWMRASCRRIFLLQDEGQIRSVSLGSC